CAELGLPESKSVQSERAKIELENKPTPNRGRFAKMPLWKKWLLVGLIISPFALGGMWFAVHTIPWMGPLVANTLRSVIGKENVTRLEDFVYSIEDRINRTVKADDKPKAYWDVPAKAKATAIPPTEKVAENSPTQAKEEEKE